MVWSLSLKGAALMALAQSAHAQDYDSSPPKYPSPWGSGSGDWADAYTKARAFVSELTLLEKVNLTTGTGWEGEACVGTTGSIPSKDFAPFCLQDSPTGVRDTDYNSAFPAGVNVAATFSRSLAYARGMAMGQEFNDKGVDVALGPVAGPLGRAPEGGRNWEGFAPDPYITGQLLAESIKGIQDAGVIACAKHFVGNEQEHFRQQSEAASWGDNISAAYSANIDDKTMHEMYLWPFADAVKAGVGSIMCSYNQLNQSYACGNSYLLNYILKNELDFQGFVVSDWAAQHSGVETVAAGLDMTMPGDDTFVSGHTFWGTNLTIAVLNGTVPEWRLDDMATRIMAAYYKIGRDEHRIPVNFNSWTLDTYGYEHPLAGKNYMRVNEHVDVRGDHASIIREVGAKSAVLLKNSANALPLTGSEKFTAIFGEDSTTNPYGVNGCSDRSCDNGTVAMGWGSGTANFPYIVTPENAITNEVLSKGGVVQTITDNWALTQAEALARQASVALVFVEADSGEGYLEVDGNIGDRNNLTLWKNGDALIKNVSANCNNTIVVMHTVGAVLVDEWYDNENITAIIWAGLPGQESGNSIVDVLYGKVNPAGRSPFTWGKTRESYGTDIMYKQNNGDLAPQLNFTEGTLIDYRYFDSKNETPIYEFGYGLSYTTFEYSNLTVTSTNAAAYVPTNGTTAAAPVLGNFSTDPSLYQYPDDVTHIKYYIYPYLNSTNLSAASEDTHYGMASEDYLPAGFNDSSPQPLLPAGGAPGGNAQLWDVLYEVTATITNTGGLAGDEVPQLYVSLGGDNPPVQLRGFDRITIPAGGSAVFSACLTRRDLSNWDTASQNWVITDDAKTVYVGKSSRQLDLSYEIPSASASTYGSFKREAGAFNNGEKLALKARYESEQFSEGPMH